MANILESPTNIEDEAFEEEIDVEREDFELVEPRNYDDLLGLPQINGVTLTGNKTSSELGIVTQEQVDNAIQAESQARSTADTELNNKINAESTARGEADTALGTRIDNEALARQSADNGLQTQIDAITSKSDVVDVVANYAALQDYDTSALGNNDVVKVLDDETHEDALTYYRWSTTTQAWSYIGQEAPYYSKGQMDTKLAEKQDKLTAGDNIQISNDTISATDTKYTAGNGLNLNGTEFSADTDVLATKEDLENHYTKTEVDNRLAPKLEAEVVAELPTAGDEGKLYLTPKAHTTQTATGNPITATVAEEAGKIESFQLDGDTFQQTYTGKNLWTYSEDNWFFDSQNTSYEITQDGELKVTATAGTYQNSDFIVSLADGTYTFSLGSVSVSNADMTVKRMTLSKYNSDHTGRTLIKHIDEGTPQTVTITNETGKVYALEFWATYGTSISNTATFSNIQIEAGSTATDYEPYVGGTPSPNPAFPQPIQTVTGEQTITINGTDYPLDLGDIQLCGLGDDGNGNPLYKDRIYRDGEDWKVHKATGKYIFTGEERSTWDDTIPRIYLSVGQLADIGIRPVFPNSQTSIPCAVVSKFTAKSFKAFYTDGESNGFAMSQTGKNFNFGDKNWTQKSDGQADMNGAIVYYALETPTDTTITDTDLIAQLEAIRTASLQNGANTITNTATGSNLAGDMEIGYYGFSPRNRYDKWLWLDINNEYEQIGS